MLLRDKLYVTSLCTVTAAQRTVRQLTSYGRNVYTQLQKHQS